MKRCCAEYKDARIKEIEFERDEAYRAIRSIFTFAEWKNHPIERRAWDRMTQRVLDEALAAPEEIE